MNVVAPKIGLLQMGHKKKQNSGFLENVSYGF
jgi:hypothetical protein